MPTSTAPVAAPLPRGRAVEMNDWVDETFRYITTKSQPLDEETPPSWPSVRVPLTLAFRYTRPSAWYEWSEELRATRETACAETVEEILERFRQHNEAINGEARCDILATYVYNRAPPPDSGAAPVTCLEHMDEALLVDFLRHRKREHNGVLQGFVVPTGGRATCLRARVHASGRFVLESRTNRVPLADARRGVRERAVTFEGAEHEVRGRPVATGTAVHAAAVALARQVCDHVLRLLPRQYAVHEATFYLRVQGDCQLYLLYAPVVGLALRETGAPLPQPLPKSPRAVEPELSFMGALPRDYFRCPTCGAAARAQHCTKVPFKSVLMHVCVLDASDGVVDGDNEAIEAINSVLDRVAKNPEYWAELYEEAERARPSESTVRLLRRSGYPGGHLELDDQLETPGERACFRLLQTAMRDLTPAHYKWVRKHKPELLYRIGIFVCTECSLAFSQTALAQHCKTRHQLGRVALPKQWEGAAQVDLVIDDEPTAADATPPRRGRRERQPEPTPASLDDNQVRKSRSLPLLPRLCQDRAAAAKSRPWRAAEKGASEEPRFAPVRALGRGGVIVPRKGTRSLPRIRHKPAPLLGGGGGGDVPPLFADDGGGGGGAFLTQHEDAAADDDAAAASAKAQLPRWRSEADIAAPAAHRKWKGPSTSAERRAGAAELRAGHQPALHALERKAERRRLAAAASSGQYDASRLMKRSTGRAAAPRDDDDPRSDIARLRKMSRAPALAAQAEKSLQGAVARVHGRVLPIMAELRPGVDAPSGDSPTAPSPPGGEIGGVSIAEELKTCMTRELGRVVDLFRDLDLNEDGTVSKREFRKALPLLGFSLPTASRRDIDLLFDEFDANGDGQIKYDELRGRLRNFASERRAKAS